MQSHTQYHDKYRNSNRNRKIDDHSIAFLEIGSEVSRSCCHSIVIRTFLGVTVTSWDDAILYSRCIMQREAAGIPTPAPIRNFVASDED